jgi:serine/threonine-protein kinase
MFGIAVATETEQADEALLAEPLDSEPLSPTPTSAILSAGYRFGNYELIEVVGRGGMGVVYKARQLTLGRTVALKMLSAGCLASEQELRRFQGEAEAAAGLNHPNVVSVHEVGELEGRYFFSMQYIEGNDLAEILKKRKISFRDAARYIQQVANAVLHAHENGVLHRDLKPSNVLIDSADQVQVTDFGLAKRVGDKSDITLSGQILGTPSYMSPEQAGAERSKIGRPTDTYSIGALLYHLLTGRPPFHGENSMETLKLVREADPVLPREYNPAVPRELEMICLKCLEKRPNRRYASARALADDLQRYLDGESISIGSVRLFNRLVNALERGHYDVEMRAWGTMCLWFAAIITAAHFLVFLQTWKGPSTYSPRELVAGRICEFFAVGIVMWVNRRDCYPVRTVASRQLWVLWIAYLAGSMVLAQVSYVTWSTGPGNTSYDVLNLYPQLAVLSGLGFFVMGSSYWGGCHALGACLFLLALFMPFIDIWAPLVFGLIWGLGLAAVGRRLLLLAAD